MATTKIYKKTPIYDIKLIKPVWHMKTVDVDLSLQPDQLIEKYIDNGFHIYKTTWTNLHSALDPLYSKLYMDNSLWTKNQDHDKIARVLDNWKAKTSLIPPMLIDNGYNKLVPADGKHRIKVASILDKTEIAFILFNIDLPIIKSYFDPILID